MPEFHELSDMVLDEISLCPSGDNVGAEVVIAKSADHEHDDGHDHAEEFELGEGEDEYEAEEGEDIELDAATLEAIMDETEEEEIEKVPSSAYPDLERKKGNKDNWVEAAGGLPSYIERIAKHLHYEQGMSISHAIASAVNQVKKWAAGGKNVSPATRAKAAKAVAEWEAKKAKAKVTKTEWIYESFEKHGTKGRPGYSLLHPGTGGGNGRTPRAEAAITRANALGAAASASSSRWKTAAEVDAGIDAEVERQRQETSAFAQRIFPDDPAKAKAMENDLMRQVKFIEAAWRLKAHSDLEKGEHHAFTNENAKKPGKDICDKCGRKAKAHDVKRVRKSFTETVADFLFGTNGETKSPDFSESSGTLLSTPQQEEMQVPQPNVGNRPEIKKDDLPEEVVTYLNALEAQHESTLNELAGLKASVGKSGDAKTPEQQAQEELAKASPALRAIIEKAQREADEANLIAKAERDARIQREMIAKAESLPMISTDKAELAGLLSTLHANLDAPTVSKVESILKAANEQISTGNLFDTLARSGEQSTIAKSVESQAKALRDADPKLTMEQAINKVYEQDPSLYDAELKGA